MSDKDMQVIYILGGIFFVISLIGGWIYFFLMQYIIKWRGRKLRKKFDKMGNPVGKTKAEIVSCLGNPTSLTQEGDVIILQWLRLGFHIALNMKDDVCTGIKHQNSQVG